MASPFWAWKEAVNGLIVSSWLLSPNAVLTVLRVVEMFWLLIPVKLPALNHVCGLLCARLATTRSVKGVTLTVPNEMAMEWKGWDDGAPVAVPRLPPLTCTAQGRVCPEMVTCQVPVLLVVSVSALPPAHLTLTLPPTIGSPTAAVPDSVLGATTVSLPPQADRKAAEISAGTTTLNILLTAFCISSLLRLKMMTEFIFKNGSG